MPAMKFSHWFILKNPGPFLPCFSVPIKLKKIKSMVAFYLKHGINKFKYFSIIKSGDQWSRKKIIPGKM